MKKIIFASITAFAVIVSGCATKNTSVSSSSSVDGSKGSGGVDSYENINSLNSISNVYFDFDKFNIRNDMQKVVADNASVFNKDAANASIVVEGNCDEWGTDEYNQALGLKRAKAVKEALVAQGVNADRISVKSYGETNPVCTERTKACDAQNRRAEFKLAK
ncbi:peptidoglycan-associated lipoprotein Pal [Campylobacter peloridis]|uniref:Peptidoglycan-associated lipoprotein n=1 Tax=Campylobacter peloridis TaxID=488546 RepID=A0A5C7DP82_9BACT|nr:peptidoglycan-associated lipoprotein Pal [Campylobacter peloridis]AJC84073.1 Tol-Pal system peptidoglycan-associated lipoprotein [Campylobacter peloridis LMG 23910]MBX1886827.1 peptidoglycan-associated lipoprotein Pal [Campylobacter peloridis]MBX2077952.1 peptidoglycan-associated lipoprotein Pal [Campylobacter peloridis]QOQ89662.1 peptidoglycan-associated lipoprotein Pal [Campylobacter peloridis]TXE84443.1 peptidoglycan-associated lipoprotein Pal [Campylobacter peloridis]